MKLLIYIEDPVALVYVVFDYWINLEKMVIKFLLVQGKLNLNLKNIDIENKIDFKPKEMLVPVFLCDLLVSAYDIQNLSN